MLSWIVNRKPAVSERKRSSDVVTATTAADRSASPSSVTVVTVASYPVLMHPNRTEHGELRGSELGGE